MGRFSEKFGSTEFHDIVEYRDSATSSYIFDVSLPKQQASVSFLLDTSILTLGL